MPPRRRCALYSLQVIFQGQAHALVAWQISGWPTCRCHQTGVGLEEQVRVAKQSYSPLANTARARSV